MKFLKISVLHLIDFHFFLETLCYKYVHMNQIFSINQEELLSHLNRLADVFNSKNLSNDKDGITPILKNFLFEQVGFLSKKEKALFDQLFSEESKQILESLKRYEEKRKIQFEEYVYALPQRIEDLKLMLEEIESYPLKSITKKVKKICKNNKMCPELIISLIKKVKTTVINTVIKEAIAFETTQWNIFYEAEITKINVNYYVQNEALKILSPNQYQKHLDIVMKTMRAYHQDMRAFLANATYNFTPIWNFFDRIMQHIKSLQDVQLSMSA